MKRLAYILVIMVMLFNGMGYFVVFKASQYSIKKEIKKKLKSSVPNNELHVIAVAVKDEAHRQEFRWVHSREFQYRGCMYDIVRTETRNDTIIYHCINDVEEQILFAQLDELVSTHHDQNPVRQKSARTLTKNIVREAVPESFEITSPENFSVIDYNEKQFCYQNPVQDILLPPPKS